MVRMLEVKNLSTQFKIDQRTIKAVDQISYYIDYGEIVGLVEPLPRNGS
ncbi:hypothetical protein ACFL7M_14695 [Thermodesulfobacteriota bacterium]